MERKCICLIRISTEIQSLQQQTEEVVKMAKLHGFNEVGKDIFPIENIESAVKLKEEERQGLTEMKRMIEEDPTITHLFVYEISRISRRAEVVFSIRNYCQEKHIQIIICKPSIMVFKEDWTLDENANLMFSIFSAMAENEGFIRKERFARGKKNAANLGKRTGGLLPFGYTVDEDNMIIENKEESKILREIYADMASGKYSVKKLWNEYKEQGFEMKYGTFFRMLKYSPYIGIMPKRHKLKKKMPIILDKELFDKVQKVMAENVTNKSKESKHNYLGNKLVLCPHCGRHLTINKSTYKCFCNGEESPYIKTSVMDGILWNLAKFEEIVYLATDTESKVNEINKEISVLESKLKNAEESGTNIDQRKERIFTLFEMGNINEKQMKMRLEKVEQEDQERQKQIAEFKSRITAKKQQLKDINSKADTTDIINNAFDMVESVDVEKEMRQIVRRHIYKVYAYRGKENDERFVTLEFEFVNGKKKVFRYYPFFRRSQFQIKEMTENGTFEFNPLLDNPIYRSNGKIYDLFTYNKGGINYNIEAERDKKRIEKAIKRNEQRETAK